MPKTKRKIKRKTKIKLVIIAFFLLLFLLALELTVRILFPQESAIYATDNQVGWKFYPSRHFRSISSDYENHFVINNEGYIDYNHNFTKQEGVKRIAFIGDSFTAGAQVPFDKSFVRLFDKELNSESNIYEVFNFGVPATGTNNQLLVLRNEAKKYHPDVVILVFFTNDFVENNVKDGANRPEFVIADNGSLIQINNLSSLTFKERLEDYAASNYETLMFLSKIILRHNVQKNQQLDQSFEYFNVNSTYNLTRQIELSIALLDEFKKEVEEMNATLIVFSVPQPYVTDPALINNFYAENPAYINKTMDFSKVSSTVEEWAMQNNVPYEYIDIGSQYKGNRSDLHFKKDYVHWNILGQEIAADMMIKYFKSHIYI